MGRPRITKKELERRKRLKRELKREKVRAKKIKPSISRKKSAQTKKYWADVRKLKEATGLNTKQARKKLSFSPKYAKKRSERLNKKLMHWNDVHRRLQKEEKEDRKKLYEELYDEYVFFS